MDRLNIEELSNLLLENNKDILILDTCCILDIVRCIQRDNLSILKTADDLIKKYELNENQFEILLPSIIEHEWSNNINEVKADTKKYIKSTTESYKSIVNCVKMLHATEFEYTDFQSYDVENLLESCSKKIIDFSFSLKTIEECKIKAYERAAKNIPPSKKGKNSIIDCTIFEEIIYISTLLREKGFAKRIIFASSNTKEYYEGNLVIPEIADDLANVDVQIVRAFNQGHSILISS